MDHGVVVMYISIEISQSPTAYDTLKHDLLQTSSQGCHEDATRKMVPWNLSLPG